jgi:hypothetical protein
METENNALGQLSDEQREQVWDWIEEGVSLRDVEKRIKKEAPEGFGIVVSYSSVGRFARNERAVRVKEEMAEADALARELAGQIEAGTVDHQAATRLMLERKVFVAALESQGKAACELFRKLTDIKQRQERIELAEKNYELARVRFEMNTAREVMRKTSQYVELYHKPGMDNEDKVWEARRICFGQTKEEYFERVNGPASVVKTSEQPATGV